VVYGSHYLDCATYSRTIYYYTDNEGDHMSKYEFGYSRNSYFQGRDGLVTRKSDGKMININCRDRLHEGNY
jgi:hypothetical protein